MSTIPLIHVPVAAGPAYAEAIARLPSKFTATLRAETDNRFNHAAVMVMVSGEKIGYLPPEISRHYFETAKSTPGVECQGRRASVSAHENTGTDILLDLTGIPCAE
jgi:hypothetical protein